MDRNYDRDYLYVNKSHFVPVIFEPPCNSQSRLELILPDARINVILVGNDIYNVKTKMCVHTYNLKHIFSL
jgi:hypothetical protein